MVPMFMIVALIGALAVLLPIRICNDCSAPYPYQQFGMVIASLVMATGTVGAVGFLVFLIVRIGSVVYRASASVLSHYANSR
jgi:hypothetical protein